MNTRTAMWALLVGVLVGPLAAAAARAATPDKETITLTADWAGAAEG